MTYLGPTCLKKMIYFFILNPSWPNPTEWCCILSLHAYSMYFPSARNWKPYGGKHQIPRTQNEEVGSNFMQVMYTVNLPFAQTVLSSFKYIYNFTQTVLIHAFRPSKTVLSSSIFVLNYYKPRPKTVFYTCTAQLFFFIEIQQNIKNKLNELQQA